MKAFLYFICFASLGVALSSLWSGQESRAIAALIVACFFGFIRADAYKS